MRLRDGEFDVSPSEKITFTVKRKNSPCTATFAPKGWQSCDPETQPDDHTKIKVCKAPATVGAECKMTITFDFTSDTPGSYDPDDEYTIDISGQTGEPAHDSVSPPPILRERTYTFHVSQS